MSQLNGISRRMVGGKLEIEFCRDIWNTIKSFDIAVPRKCEEYDIVLSRDMNTRRYNAIKTKVYCKEVGKECLLTAQTKDGKTPDCAWYCKRHAEGRNNIHAQVDFRVANMKLAENKKVAEGKSERAVKMAATKAEKDWKLTWTLNPNSLSQTLLNEWKRPEIRKIIMDKWILIFEREKECKRLEAIRDQEEEEGRKRERERVLEEKVKDRHNKVMDNMIKTYYLNRITKALANKEITIKKFITCVEKCGQTSCFMYINRGNNFQQVVVFQKLEHLFPEHLF